MMAAGPSPRMRGSGRWCGWTSQYTACSRMRRAMSCVYCEPKSRMRTSWWATMFLRSSRVSGGGAPIGLGPSGGGRGDTPSELFDAVVGRFLGDDHVVDVALAQALRRDADELRLVAH